MTGKYLTLAQSTLKVTSFNIIMFFMQDVIQLDTKMSAFTIGSEIVRYELRIVLESFANKRKR